MTVHVHKNVDKKNVIHSLLKKFNKRLLGSLLYICISSTYIESGWRKLSVRREREEKILYTGIYYSIIHGYAPLYLTLGEMYVIQHYVIKFVNLLQVRVLVFIDGDVPLCPIIWF